MTDNIFATNNTDEARKLLANAIKTENIDHSLLVDDHGEKVDIFNTEEQVRKYNEIVSFGGFHTEEDAYTALQGCMIALFDDISDWMTSNQVSKTFYMQSEMPIGYVIDNNGNKADVTSIKLSLHKERGNNTELGFFVSSFHPIAENKMGQ